MSSRSDYTINLGFSIFITWTLFEREKSQGECKTSARGGGVQREREGGEEAKAESLRRDVAEVGTSVLPEADGLGRYGLPYLEWRGGA